MDWYFGNLTYFLLMLLLPLLGFILFRFVRWKNKRKNIFAEKRFQDFLFKKNTWFSTMLFPLYMIAIALIIMAIVDVIKGNEELETKQKTNNIIFVLDVSNSMNAEDIQPNRLTQAKNIIINALPKLKNDRVGVVVFAGDAISIMPLTNDYTAAETYLDAISTDIIKIQGTDFLKAIQATTVKFKQIAKGSRKIVLISDGEDNEDNTGTAIREANNQGISVTTVGVGTEEGAPIPSYLFGQLMGYKSDMNGETVISKLQPDALKKIANATGGNYIDGNNLDTAVNEVATSINTTKSGTMLRVKSQNGIHYYQYFLAIAAFILFFIYLFNPKKDLNI